ncbi:MAG: hypothetical protein ACO3MG_11455 [Saprospiraceae bacterium]
MSNKTEVVFHPEEHHLPVEKYGLLAQPKNEKIPTVKCGKLNIAQIDRKYLGVGKYQRATDDARIKRLSKVWHGELGVINVMELEKDGKFYYPIIDGQQRACASPNEELVAIITNTFTDVDNFRMANNRKHVKALSYDSYYWAGIHRHLTVRDEETAKDTYDEMFVFNEFEKHGYTPARQADKSKDFGSCVSKLHNLHTKYICDKMEAYLGKKNRKKALTEEQLFTARRDVFSDVMQIMTEVFGAETFSARHKYIQTFCGLMVYLARIKWNYSVTELINSFKAGVYKPKRRDPETLRNISDWDRATKTGFINIPFVRDKWAELFENVHKNSQ